MKSVVSSLLPKETPLEFIIEHGEILEEVSKGMEALTLAYFAHEDITEKVKFISSKESDADAIKFKFRKMLDKNVKVPFPKQTLLYAMHLQDDIIDRMEDIAKRMAMNYLDFMLEEHVKQDFIQLVREVQTIVAYLEEAIRELKRVLASTFSKRERKKEEKGIIRVEHVESEIDTLTLKLGKWAYSRKHDVNALDLIFFNDLVLIFAEIGDKAENLAEMIRSFTR
jgi:predicted phosphate transport protein (TIGR00153 family)